ncbi:MAG: IclR family transcriptional regulator [Alphaproteobacteria bacterium]|nr:MAG: IclR family transcriptional regulator [Alphaproteobacteria bacterium]
MQESDDRRPRIKSADRVLDVFEALTHEPRGLSFPELVSRLGVPKSSLHGLLAVLVDRQYLVFDELSRRYVFGVQLFEHGQSFLTHHGEAREARLAMQAVVAEVNETVQLGLLRGTEGVNIGTVDCTHALRMRLEVGRHFPGYATSLGKVLLAHLPEAEMIQRAGQGPLQRHTEHTLVSSEKLVAELRRIRSRGFSLDSEELVPGVFCVGVPIFDNSGQARTGMSVTIPTSRLNLDILSRALAALARESIAVSARMGVAEASATLAAIVSPATAAEALLKTHAKGWVKA